MKTNEVVSKKKVRRGRGKRDKTRNISIYYNNINGITSKKESLQKTVKDVNPDIVCLCETKLGSMGTVENLLQGYKMVGRCLKFGQGGVAIAAKKEVYSTFLDISSTENKNIMVGRVKIGGHTIRVVVGYAPQETEEEEVCEDFYTDLAIEVQGGKVNEEYTVLVGDMNAKINPISRNGRLMTKTLIDNCNLEVVNLTEKCSGKWTHVKRTTGDSSAIDYVMVTDLSKIKSMTIDEGGIMCPCHIVTEKGVRRQILSDHNAIVVELTLPYKKGAEKNTEKAGRWIISEEGLDKFEGELIASMQSESGEMRITPPNNPQEKYTHLESKLKQVMNSCFNKQSKKKKGENIMNLYSIFYILITH